MATHPTTAAGAAEEEEEEEVVVVVVATRQRQHQRRVSAPVAVVRTTKCRGAGGFSALHAEPPSSQASSSAHLVPLYILPKYYMRRLVCRLVCRQTIVLFE